MSYKKSEVIEASRSYFGGDELAADVITKYLLRLPEGDFVEKNPDEMHRRLAKEFARAESKYPNPLSEDDIYVLLAGFKYLVPQGSPMSAIGNPYQIQSLSNCFVIEQPEDSYGGILLADQEQVQIMKRRGGAGFDISKIRPRGVTTSNAARTTDGIGVFMERFSNSTREVAQGGRRGALMLTIDCRHPEIDTFLNIKRDLSKVTGANISVRFTDDFLHAVEKNEEYTLRWPVTAPVDEAKITRVVNAKEIWDQFVDSAWTSAEPGALFWDTVQRTTPADIYAEEGFSSISTNPCLASETQVAVADGRGYVSIGELAAAGTDVPVYAYDNDTGKTVIKTMRNPRLTGHKKPVYRVNIEGGHSFKATENHMMILRDGTRKTVQELQSGDQLWVAQRVLAKFNEVLKGVKATSSQKYVWMKDCNSRSWRSEHRQIWESYNKRKIKVNEVIHHIDFNAANNAIDNLKLMSKEEHDAYHSTLIRGENNPIFKIKANPKRFAEYSAKMSNSTSGLKNPRAYDVSNETLFSHMQTLMSELGRRPNICEWSEYANKHSLPVYMNSFRLSGQKALDVMCQLAEKAGISSDIAKMDTRMAARAIEAQKSGYAWRINKNLLEVERACEWCNSNFWCGYDKREISFCGHSCSNLYANRKAGKNAARTLTLQAMHAKKGAKNRLEQLNVFTKLRFELGREPTFNEWASACKSNLFPVRLGTKNGFSSWDQLKSEASFHNHRVVSVEFAGYEDVYNGTVDDVHTFLFRVGQEKIESLNNPVDIMLANEQCGEIVLCPYDSCRLMAINLSSFVHHPFTPNAVFDYNKFNDVVVQSQRLMDDLVDLEIEAIDRIRDKIANDPQPDIVKRVEAELWDKIREKATKARRTGLGITALGDALAMLGLQYGSDQSITMTEEIYRHLAIAAHKSSIIMAEERGAFPIFSYEKEKNHDFLNQVIHELHPEIQEKWKKFGRRNIALTTTAPTGSVSCLTQTTSGIEPAYLLSYKRRRKLVSNTDAGVVPDFVDASGDKWQEYTVYHHNFKKWMDVTGKSAIEDSPYYKATSNDIDWLKSVEIQAVAQRWVDHSISKTCNLPNNATKELVSQAYMAAWKSGCKGFTVYRDGCRTGVLIQETKPAETKAVERTTDKREKELPCDIHRVNIKGESWLVLVGLKNGNPYEVFCGIAENIEVPKKSKIGFIVKNGKKDGLAAYSLRVPVGNDDEILFKDIVNLFANPTHSAFTRTLSLTLRHQIPINFIVEQLQKGKNDDMFSFSRVLARVLKTYIPDGTKSTGDKSCSNCGSDSLVYMEGCITCSSCGSSRCS